MKKTIITSACLLSLATAQIVSATPTITIGGTNAPGSYVENFNTAVVGPTSQSFANGLSVVLTPDASFAKVPNLSGEYAAPFGDFSIYVASGAAVAPHPNAGAELIFSSSQNYLGLQWGSVDSYNVLSFYKNGNPTALAVIGGSAILSPADGSQGAVGTTYVNINFAGGETFDYVVATSEVLHAFEFDNVAYNNVPDGGTTMIMLGGVLCGIGAIRRRLSV